jgi:hypothetical protein
MHSRLPAAAAALLLLATLALGVLPANRAEVSVTMERAERAFGFASVPLPALDDAASQAAFTLVDGRADRNGADLAVLHDGKVPGGDDQPNANFFFSPGTDGGRLRLDLGRPVEIGSVATYSWHRTDRAPQVYTLYASTGEGEPFKADPARPLDPSEAGWTLLTKVDTRQDAKGTGTQYGVLIAGREGRSLGTYRHLLLDARQTEDKDQFGNTFFSEIDVIDAKAPAPQRLETPKQVVETFPSKDGSLRFTVDATKAPDLMPWVEKELMPVVEAWYPKMVAMMPSDGYTAATEVHMEFKDDMGGTPAYASGNRLSLSIPFFRAQLQREAKGCVIHELVHVIQSYGRARRANRNAAPTPGWVVEGTADYVRWFLYEPESQGARITTRNLPSARYDGSYRISANFLDWVVRTHEKDLLRKLNAAAREGRYSEKLWEEWTGESLADLGEAWLKHHRERLEKER